MDKVRISLGRSMGIFKFAFICFMTNLRLNAGVLSIDKQDNTYLLADSAETARLVVDCLHMHGYPDAKIVNE